MSRKSLNLRGQVFDRLTVLHQVASEGPKARWLCRCSCGTEVIMVGTVMRGRRFNSCGCQRACAACGAQVPAFHRLRGTLRYCSAACDPAPPVRRSRRRVRTETRGATDNRRILERLIAAEPVLAPDANVATHADRPRIRGDCAAGARPCPWVSCKHHLYLDVNPETGSIKINFPDREPDQLEHSCSLDVAEQDGMILDAVGEIMNLTRERTRQIEHRARLKLYSHTTGMLGEGGL